MEIMVDLVDQVNMNDEILSTNTFIIKDEQCQEDFIEDKVYISETAICIDNAELQGPIQFDKIKQYEESTCLDHIKTESASFEETELQNNNVKIGGGISADIKIEFDYGQLYCEHCEAYYVDYCIECGMLVHILNRRALNNANSGAPDDIPNDILEIEDCFGQSGIYALRTIPPGVKFGPFTGFRTTECPWVMKGKKFILNKNKLKYLNWMQYVNPTTNICDQNLHVFQSEDNIYYESTRKIQVGDELLVYFGEENGNRLNKIVRMDFITIIKDAKDVFACTFCCLGFSSRSHLTKHKTVCIEDAAGEFSIEELTQCSFCKIHLDSKEYFEHHMAFCCERNARKCILLTPQVKQATTALNGRKRCLRLTYKCKQRKYSTKCQADLKEHTNKHYEVKMYKCGICNSRFKTKGSLRLHMKNTHSYVGGNDDQEHSTTDYRNAHIKVEQSISQDEKKVFKCSLCVFRAKYKRSVRVHIKNKHLKIFDLKCDSCDFRTNRKDYLERHIKAKHVRTFDYKCDKCEFTTNNKPNLEIHLKNKHLKQFDYKCNLCGFRTNYTHCLEQHKKTKHLREFDYKCDICEYRTNKKYALKKHIQTKHLREFDFRCDECKYKTNKKDALESHIKTKHLKEFNFKCDSCEYRTNNKRNIEVHIKTKHLKKFDYKCNLCEYKINNRNNLEKHIKTKHLKIFDYKCDKCHYRTNNKYDIERHIKTKH